MPTLEKHQFTSSEIVRYFSLYPYAKTAIFDDPTDLKGLNPVYDYIQGIDLYTNQIITEHARFDPKLVRLRLEQIQYISTDDIFKVCSAYDALPLTRSEKSKWEISRGQTQIDIKSGSGFAYHIDLPSGDVFTTEGGRTLKMGCNASVIQFYMLNSYAFPVYLGMGHWANKKSPFTLGLSVPTFTVMNKLLEVIFEGDKAKIYDWYADALFKEINLNKIDVYNETITTLCQQYKIDLNTIL